MSIPGLLETLRHLPPEGAAVPRALLQVRLGAAYLESADGDWRENFERAIDLYEEALECLAPGQHPEVWAEAQMNLGNAYRNRARGDAAANKETAIEHYQRALEIRTRKTLSVEWAMTKVNLGLAFFERLRGDARQNVETAIECYLEALEVFGPDTHPYEWAVTSMNLGVAWKDRLEGDRRENLRCAVEVLTAALDHPASADFSGLRGELRLNLGRALEMQAAHQGEAAGLEAAVEVQQEAVAELDPRHQPTSWAGALINLGNALQQRASGNRRDNLERAVAAYQQALTVLSPEHTPGDWGLAQMNLGAAWKDLPGEGYDHLERAAGCLEQALTVFDPAGKPPEWAAAQVNLAQVLYRRHQQRAQAGDLERAIDRCREVLDSPMPIAPRLRTGARLYLGSALVERPLGRPEENLEAAIETYQAGLAELTRETSPADWASLMLNLGSAHLRLRAHREPQRQLQLAVEAYRQALEFHRRERNPRTWAQTTTALATALLEDGSPRRAASVERGIELLEAVLEVYRREIYPDDWVLVHDLLGTAFMRRLRGDRADNMERAAAHYRQALEERRRDLQPIPWATTQMNFGTALRNRVQGDRAENLEESLQAVSRALEVLTRRESPRQWALARMNLGIVYGQRLRGDAARNIELALEAYDGALEILHPQSHWLDWALVTMNRSTAVLKRTHGDLDEQREEAIRDLEAALNVHSRDAFPHDWAVAMSNLGLAYRQRRRGDAEANADLAIAAFEATLEVWTEDHSPYFRGLTHLHLSATHSLHPRATAADIHPRQALASGQKALEVFDRRSAPFEWASTQMNLAYAWYLLREGQRDNARAAQRAWRRALTILRPDVAPEDCRRAALLLGDLAFEEGRWEPAAAAYRRAISAQEALFRANLLHRGRLSELAAAGALYRRAAFALARCGHSRKAVEVAEQGRARGLREALVRDAALLEELSRREPALGERLRQVGQQLHLLQRRERGLRPDEAARRQPLEALYAESEAGRNQLEEVLAEVRKVPGFENFLRPLGYDDLAAAAEPDRPLIYLVTADTGTLALVIESQSAEELENQPTVFLTHDWREEDLRAVTFPETGGDADWFRALEPLGTSLLAALSRHLEERGARAVTLVPAGRLGLLPLHAISLTGPDSAAEAAAGPCLLDRLPVAYAPSAASLLAARRQRERREAGPDRLLGIADPAVADGGDALPFARAELAAVAESFPEPELLFGEAAGVEALLRHAAEATHVHLACHAVFDPADPLQSYLLLAGGERLTLHRLLDEAPLRAARLVVLAACESARIEAEELPDELIGWPAGILESGVPVVIASLWKVDDLAAALLMIRFYHEAWQAPEAPAAALRNAQSWLRTSLCGQLRQWLGASLLPRELRDEVRGFLAAYAPDERPFAAPRFWSGFVMVGG